MTRRTQGKRHDFACLFDFISRLSRLDVSNIVRCKLEIRTLKFAFDDKRHIASRSILHGHCSHQKHSPNTTKHGANEGAKRDWGFMKYDFIAPEGTGEESSWPVGIPRDQRDVYSLLKTAEATDASVRDGGAREQADPARRF